MPIGIVKKVYPTWLAFVLDARGNINALPKDVIVVNNDVANAYSNEKCLRQKSVEIGSRGPEVDQQI